MKITHQAVLMWVRCALFLPFLLAVANATPAEAFTLTVENGSGGGEYPEGTVVTIWANPQEDPNPELTTGEPIDASQPMRIFDPWVGDTSEVEDIESPQTTVFMPANDVSIGAQYKDSPRWLNPSVLAYFPEDYTGVIFMFHGVGGCASCLLENSESRTFLSETTAQGYAVVALDSYDRVSRDWSLASTPDDNPDLRRVAALRQDLITRGLMTASDPVYLVGISGGGRFASLFTQAVQDELQFPVQAMALYISPGLSTPMLSATVPTIFVAGINDTTVPYSSVATSYGLLLSQGVATQLVVIKPSPLYPDRFWRIDGISSIDSHVIYDAIDAAGLLDGEGYLMDNPETVDWQSVIPSNYLSYTSEIREQLKATYGEHTLVADVTSRVLGFLANPATVVELAPVINGFTPTSGPPGTIVTISGSNFVDVLEVTIGGASANFVVITSSTITAVVPSDAVTGPITVTNSVGTDTSTGEFGVAAPTITGFNPISGRPGTLVTISGTGFANLTDVSFNGISASFSTIGPGTVVSTVPAEATTGPISVTNSLGVGVSGTPFDVLGPVITSFSPAVGGAGTFVIIAGENLVNVEEVAFNGVPASFISRRPTTVTSTVPTGATTGPITVRNAQGTAVSATAMVLYAAPVITSMSPTQGAIGDPITLIGENFAPTETVSFGGIEAVFTVVSDTEITAIVPPGSTTLCRIKVSTPGGNATTSGWFHVQ